ncbi:hypothetical protein ACPA9J_16580 [Pseudomonas aeruginosa]
MLILGVNGFIGNHLSGTPAARRSLRGPRHGHRLRRHRTASRPTRISTSSKATSASIRSGSNTM